VLAVVALMIAFTAVGVLSSISAAVTDSTTCTT
jgi:hypothetical protein